MTDTPDGTDRAAAVTAGISPELSARLIRALRQRCDHPARAIVLKALPELIHRIAANPQRPVHRDDPWFLNRLRIHGLTADHALPATPTFNPKRLIHVDHIVIHKLEQYRRIAFPHHRPSRT